MQKMRKWALIGGSVAVLMELIRTPAVDANRTLPGWFGWVTAASTFVLAFYLWMRIESLRQDAQDGAGGTRR